MTSSMRFAILILIASATAHADPAPAGTDYGPQVRAMFRVAACGGDDAIPERFAAKVIDAHCNFPGDAYGCDATGLAAASAAKPLSVASTVGLVVGAVGVGTGLALFFSDPSRGTTRGQGYWGAGLLTAGRDGTSFGLQGAW